MIIFGFGNFPYWLRLLYLLCGLSMVSLTSILSLFFTTEFLAQNVVIVINFLLDVLGGSVILVLRISADLACIAETIAYHESSPSFCFAYGYKEVSFMMLSLKPLIN